MDTTPLGTAYRTLLDAAAAVAEHGGPLPAPPPGEWDADQVLAHVCVLTATTLVTVATVAAGAHPSYDNRAANDEWNLARTAARAGGGAGLRDRVLRQGQALCAAGGALSDAELDTLVPTLLLSHGAVMVDGVLPLRDLLAGLAAAELPGHTDQLLALLPRDADTAAAVRGGRGHVEVPDAGRAKAPARQEGQAEDGRTST